MKKYHFALVLFTSLMLNVQLGVSLGYAEERSTLNEIAVSEYGSSGPLNVADNIRLMDQNHDGMVSSDEVSNYLRKGDSLRYSAEVLNALDKEMQGQRCGSPFSGSVY